MKKAKWKKREDHSGKWELVGTDWSIQRLGFRSDAPTYLVLKGDQYVNGMGVPQSTGSRNYRLLAKAKRAVERFIQKEVKA